MTASRPAVRVVVVEDDVFTMARLMWALQRDARVQVIASLDRWRTAHDWLRENDCDVLLTDIGLPDGSGIDLVRECTSRHPAADIMIISMFADDQNVLASIEAGATGYILKDEGLPNFVEAVMTLRAGGSPMSPLIARRLLLRVKDAAQSAPVAQPVRVARAQMPELTDREVEILRLISRGFSYKETAEMLSLSVSTIQTHIKNMYRKLAVHSRSEAVFEAQALGLLNAASDTQS